MKKLLALVLALVMTLGLATVGANAALSDFTDGSQTAADYQEALGVMNMVGVFMGSDGKITPKENLTRAQAAKIIAYLALGETTAESLPNTQVFADVPATHWAAKYVAYCKDAGILQAVDANNNFNPNGELTGYMFGAYLLAVLGYDRAAEGITGNDWAINAATLMGENGIGNGVDKAGSVVLTREEGAQYAFEALKADTYKYTGKSATVTTGDTTVEIGKGEATAITGGSGKLDKVHPTDTSTSTQQLGEKLYGSKLDVDTFADDVQIDQYGRPANKWTFTESGKPVKTVYASDAADLTVENKNLSTTNLQKALRDAGFTGTLIDTASGGTVYLDGSDTYAATALGIVGKGQTATVAEISSLTGPGAVVEFYDTNSDNVADQIFITLQYIDKVTAAKITAATSAGVPRYITLGGSYDLVTDNFAAGDYVVYTRCENELDNVESVSVKVASAALAQSFTGAATALGVSSNANVSVTAAGTTYPLSRGYWDNNAGDGVKQGITDDVDVTATKNTYTFYQDMYGNVIKAVTLEEGVSTDYVYIYSYQITTDTATLTSSNAVYAKAYFVDGDSKVINLKVNSSKQFDRPNANGTISADQALAGRVASSGYNAVIKNWFAYVANSDGTYSLKAVNPDYAFVKTVSSNQTNTNKTAYGILADAFAGKTTYYTAKDTSVVRISDDGKVSTKAGFDNFTLQAGKVLVTYPKSSAIKITAIYAVGQTGLAGNTAATYAYAVKKDADVAKGEQWTFAVDGAQVHYAMESGNTPVAGRIYTLTTSTENEGYYKIGSTATTQRGVVYFVDNDAVVITNYDMATTTYELSSDVKIYNADRIGTHTIAESAIGTPLDAVEPYMDVKFIVDDSKVVAIWVADASIKTGES